jgi:hypothetical protein
MKPSSPARPRAKTIALFALTAALAGCAASPRLFVNRQADMTLYKQVVIVPFGNLSGDPFAPGRVMRAFTTELVIADRFRLVDPSLLLGELDRVSAQPDATGQFEISKVRDAATKLQATAIIRGTVTEYATHRAGTDEYPVVSFDCEMVDTQTGIVVWRMSINQSGQGRLPIVGGSGSRTFARVTEEACQRAVALLRAKIL